MKMQRKSNHVQPLNQHFFAVSKDEWNTKEGTAKSMKNALYICSMPKGTSQAEAMSNSGKSKRIALAIVTSH